MRKVPPKNGVQLSALARANVEELVGELVTELRELACRVERAHYTRGSREWRRECWTRQQRADLKGARAALRHAAKLWKK